MTYKRKEIDAAFITVSLKKMNDNNIRSYANYYEEYCNGYDEYKKIVRRLKGFEEYLTSKKNERSNLEYLKKDSEKSLKIKESEFKRAHTLLMEGEKSYRQNSKRRSKEIAAEVASYKKELEKNSRIPDPQFGKYTSGTAYEKDIQIINSKYDAQQASYKSQRQAAILGKLEKLNEEKESFQSNPEEAARLKIEAVDSQGKVYAKIESLDDYLESPKVRRHSITKEIKSDIASRNFIPGDCGNSVSDLKDKVLRLIDVTKLPRENKKDPEEAKRYLSANPSLMVITLSIAAAVALLAGFIMLFPLDEVLPHVFDTSGWWWIFGWLAWLLDSARFLVLWAVQLILCVVAYFCVYELLSATSLAVLFYHPQSEVEKGLLVFQKEYNANKGVFALLFDFNKAAQVALGKEIDKNINQLTAELAHITEEDKYKKLEAQRQNEIYLLQEEKTKQLKERYDLINQSKEQALEREKANSMMVRLKEQELNREEDRRLDALKRGYKLMCDTEKTSKAEVDKCRSDLSDYTNRLKQCNQEIQEAENQKRNDMASSKQMYEKLQQYTKNMHSRKFFEDSAASMFSPDCIEAVDGNLSDTLYFVSKELDEEQLATIQRTQSACRPLVCLYKRSELSSANLCNELADFIKWYGETLERVNPLPLIDGRQFVVVDTATGAELFQDNKEYYAFRAISSNSDIKAYAGHLKAQSDLIRFAAAELNTDMNIDSVNNKKAEINRTAIPHATKLNIMQEQYCPYCIAFFIMPAEVQGHIHDNSGLTEELQQYFHNCELYGFMPIFLIDIETWENKNPSPSVEYLKKVISTRDYRYISGIGTRPCSELMISQTPILT